MRTFYRRYFTHNRYVSATATPLDALQLDTAPPGSTPIDLSALFIDLRPYMNRSPFSVRKDCSASRAHQVCGMMMHVTIPPPPACLTRQLCLFTTDAAPLSKHQYWVLRHPGADLTVFMCKSSGIMA